MKNIIKILLTLFLSSLAVSCNGWLEPEAKDITGIGFGRNPQVTNPDEYYQALRAYKKTDHPIAFGWFGNWTGKGASLENCMAGLPDSVDVISSWGGWRNLTEAQKADLKFVQEVKGTKVLAVFIVQDLGSGNITPAPHNADESSIKAFWGWKDDDENSIMDAIEKYANAICDTIDKYHFDGFDIDYEPNYGHWGSLSGYPNRMMKFVETMGKRMGPKSGTDKIFVIDGEPQSMPAESGSYFDYFIVQAYGCSGDNNLDYRLRSTINNFTGHLTGEQVAAKYVVTENFENWALSGGVGYTDRYGKRMKSLEGMARWTPIVDGKKVRKGGVGTYHMEYEYRVDGKKGTYPFLRQAMQIMNPPIKY